MTRSSKQGRLWTAVYIQSELLCGGLRCICWSQRRDDYLAIDKLEAYGPGSRCKNRYRQEDTNYSRRIYKGDRLFGIRFGGHGRWRRCVGLCGRTWRRAGTDGAVATADPCVNRALGVFLMISTCKSPPWPASFDLDLAKRSSLSFFPNPNTIHNPQFVSVPAKFIHTRQHIPRITRRPASTFSDQQSSPTPCRQHTDTTRGCRTPQSHLSAVVPNEETVAAAAMAQSRLQAASRSALA